MKLLFGNQEILNSSQLRRLGEHKYSCSSSSFMDALMQPYWNWLVLKLPISLAPNLITIAGLAVNVVTALILVFYSPNAREEVPRWACFLCALGLFVYQSLDAVDGKQARRTGTSSPLGELFDHGCDSISTVFVALAACIAVQLGDSPDWMFFQCITAISLFYSAHWQTYVSGTLRFGKFDVTEAQFGVIGLQLISAFFGSSVWGIKIPGINLDIKYIPAVLILIGIGISFIRHFSVIFTGGAGKNGATVAIPVLQMQLKLIPVAGAVLVATYFCYSNVTVIFTGGVGKNGSSVADTSVLSPFIPFSLVIVPAFIIYQKSITHLYEEHPCLYIIAFGLVAAKVTNRLVVAHMTRSEMDYLDSVLVGPGMLFLNQYFNTAINEYTILWISMMWIIFDLVRYCTVVCNQICRHLGINLFIIPSAVSIRPASQTVLNMKHQASKNGTGSKRSLSSVSDGKGQPEATNPTQEEVTLHSLQEDMDCPSETPLLVAYLDDDRSDSV